MFGNRAIWVEGWKAVTLHAHRMPWVLGITGDPDDDVWELYNTNEDFSESTDLADKYPEKLEELKQIFDDEAWKNNVYPLYDDMITRLGAVNDILFGDQKEFVYFAPGAVRIAEKASAPVKGRPHRIETTVDLKGDEEGVIVSCGGMTGGYSMYIKDRKLHFDYNFLDGVHYHLTSDTLPKGKTDLKFNFILTKPFGGTGEIYVNGKKVDETEMPRMHISTYSLAETFDIGIDTGTQVDPGYEGSPFPYTGELDRVTITMTD
jgi:arylsulfatase